jgi:two-component system cell cycle sensor histidine kinase/response regulator CckA
MHQRHMRGGVLDDHLRLPEREQRVEDARRLEAVGRLAAGIAHDFNNLLSVILTYSGELEMSLTDSEKREQAAEIRAAADRGARLTRQLLAYTRRESSEGEPIDLNRAVRDTVQLLIRVLGEDVQIRTEPAAGLPRALLAPGQAEQILVNLATNARDAMPDGGILTIATRLSSISVPDSQLGTGWYVRLSVTDSGGHRDRPEEGIDRDGPGLGTAAIHQMVRSAGGDVRVSTEPEGGTTVSVYLPAIRGNGDPLSLPAPPSD